MIFLHFNIISPSAILDFIDEIIHESATATTHAESSSKSAFSILECQRYVSDEQQRTFTIWHATTTTTRSITTATTISNVSFILNFILCVENLVTVEHG
jgi:hypothetical protein